MTPEAARHVEALWETIVPYIIPTIILFAVLLLIDLACSIWTGFDAQRRGIPGLLAGVLMFLLWPISFVVWFFIRPPVK